MQKPSERHKLTSDNNIIKFKKPVHDPFNVSVLKGIEDWTDFICGLFPLIYSLYRIKCKLNLFLSLSFIN